MYVVSPFLYSGIILSSIFSIYGELCDKTAVVPCLGTAAFLSDGIMRGILMGCDFADYEVIDLVEVIVYEISQIFE